MVREIRKRSMGAWAFLVGVILVLVMAVFNLQGNLESWAVLILVIAGVLIGLLNVTERESSKFLLAALALVIVSYTSGNVILSLQGISYVGSFIGKTLTYLMVLFIPTTIIVALKSVFAVAKD